MTPTQIAFVMFTLVLLTAALVIIRVTRARDTLRRILDERRDI